MASPSSAYVTCESTRPKPFCALADPLAVSVSRNVMLHGCNSRPPPLLSQTRLQNIQLSSIFHFEQQITARCGATSKRKPGFLLIQLGIKYLMTSTGQRFRWLRASACEIASVISSTFTVWSEFRDDSPRRSLWPHSHTFASNRTIRRGLVVINEHAQIR